MKDQKQPDKVGATPAKLVLIGVLSLVLVVVIVRQLPESKSPRVQAQGAAPSSTGEPAASSKKIAAASPSSSEKKNARAPWPKTEISELLTSDPFAAPDWAIAKVEDPVEQEAGKLNELQKQGVSIVMFGEDGKSATIGEQKVRIGDVLEGYKITDITAQGVVVSKLDN